MNAEREWRTDPLTLALLKRHRAISLAERKPWSAVTQKVASAQIYREAVYAQNINRLWIVVPTALTIVMASVASQNRSAITIIGVCSTNGGGQAKLVACINKLTGEVVYSLTRRSQQIRREMPVEVSS